MTSQSPVSVLVIGAGGHALEVGYAVSASRAGVPEYVITSDAVAQPAPGRPSARLLTDEDLARATVVIAIGSGLTRASIARSLGPARIADPVIHPTAVIDGFPDIGVGSVLLAQAYVSATARLGVHVHMNVGSSVSHESELQDFVTLGPGARIAGNVIVETGATVGMNASVINGELGSPLVIGAFSIVAAGACVTRSVPPRALVAGVPAVVKRLGDPEGTPPLG
ncbi:sugar O-acyltransferase (sialic acid O-acetyltransferase NeuD family) [Microcella putealis]|uniref:Sugar O-acyltransferase (Sialic acid O-acetyltransferase NeuD family) n=1 Tax=Microcella putealis TaxID=337005 RepID=A0A4Q7LR97_9MICO|nr:acetyltransferase [Microcella putealis]RZS57415.1 sugar O-acyltransferase (sialic acid O-acetyltransferase NeuD family) [Microcella putealis]TQM19442.1 sugar O-acyltransferase (sialic acid O-acetyltransferase NeuD family) [Microcella putealis]